MWTLIFIGLALYYLIQITTWTPSSFQKGIVILKYQIPFPGKIPDKVLNQEIVCKNIIFKFSTTDTGLFRAHPKISFSRLNRYGYIPSVLGEIKLGRNSVAQITFRIPLSVILISLAVSVLFALFLSATSAVMAILLISIVVFFAFFIEKDDLEDGVIMLIERAESNSFSKSS